MSYTKFPFEVKELPYSYNALEPVISEETLYYHHDKHYATYVDNLNNLLVNKPDMKEMTLEDIIRYTTGKTEYRNIFNNAGGVYNHMMYFDSMRPLKYENLLSDLMIDMEIESTLDKRLMNAIYRDFVSVDNLIESIVNLGISLFGSGYVSLVSDVYGRLYVKQYANQDTPLSEGLCPILLIDVWEHAYYIDYRNVRKEYVMRWKNLINLEEVNNNYLRCISG